MAIRLDGVFLLLLAVAAIFLPLQAIGFLFFFNELPAFMLGYALYLLLHRQGSLYVAIGLLLVSVVGVYFKHPTFAYYFTSLITSVLLVVNARFPLKNNFFSRLGDYSYSVYLIHVPVGIYLLGFIKGTLIVQQSLGLTIAADIALLTIVLLCAKLMFKWVEVPSIKLGRRYSS